MKPTILIVEDEFIIALDLQQKLLSLGYQAPMIAATGEDALQMTKELNPDLILMDIVLAGSMDGIEVAGKIKEFSDVPVIYTTSYSDRKILDRAKRTNAYGYITKPYETKDLVIAIEISVSRHQSQKMVSDNEKRFRLILESSGDVFFVFDKTGKILDINAKAESLLTLSREEIVGSFVGDQIPFMLTEAMSIGDFVSKVDALGSTLDLDGCLVTDSKKVFLDCRFCVFKGEGDEVLYLALGRDVTQKKTNEIERQEMFLQLAHSSKLATLGTMSASVIHELKNPLTSILGFSDILLQKGDVSEGAKSKLKIIKNAAIQMRNYVDHLRSFVRQDQVSELVDLDVGEAVDGALLLLSGQTHDMKIEVQKVENLSKIHGNMSQIESVLQNFISNSCDAFSGMVMDNAEKCIRIFTEERDGYVFLNYEDNAGGIPSEFIHKMFDPFFTTKKVGEGTGLGLSMVRYIMEQHRGYIELIMKTNIGVRFVLKFPSVEQFHVQSYDREKVVTKMIEDDGKRITIGAYTPSASVSDEGVEVSV
ncbi:MAG: response regulator [Oligoflexales bacterium]|nr:response regulator [Oligoflexales bacterium]